MKSYEDLVAWQEAMDLVDAIYATSSRFPADERFGLVAQIRRAAVSVPSNIAEGHARSSTRDFLRFLSMSMGSIAEVHTQVLIAQRLRFIDPDAGAALCSRIGRLGRMLRGLMKSLNAKVPPVPRPQPPTP